MTIDQEASWCDDLERLLRQRRIRLRSRRATHRGYLYACDRPGATPATVWVPRGVVASGVYGLNAAIAEIEDALSPTGAARSK